MQRVHKFLRLILVISRDFSCHLKMMSGVQFESKMALERGIRPAFQTLREMVVGGRKSGSRVPAGGAPISGRIPRLEGEGRSSEQGALPRA